MALEKDIADAKKVTEKLEKQLKELSKKMDVVLSMLKHAEEKREMNSLEDETLITVREASKILGVNANKVKKLKDSGEIMMVEPPGCRGKILRSSIIKYIKRLQEMAG